MATIYMSVSVRGSIRKVVFLSLTQHLSSISVCVGVSFVNTTHSPSGMSSIHHKDFFNGPGNNIRFLCFSVGIIVNLPITQRLIVEKLVLKVFLFTDVHLNIVIPNPSITADEPVTR